MDETLQLPPPQRVREGIYFHSDQEYIIRILGEERYSSLFGDLYSQLFEYPSFSFHQRLLAGIISDIYLNPSNARNDGYSEFEIIATTTTLQELATYLGLIQGKEIQRMHETGNPIKLDTRRRVFTTYEDLKTHAQESLAKGNIHGIVHGSFDPPYIGHARAIQSIWPFCNKIYIGIDGNKLLSSRKSGSPRFPLPWRMMELGQLPTVDKVFVLPFDLPPKVEAWEEMYSKLGIKVLGTGADNAFLPEYRQRMSRLGGHVIVEKRGGISSTFIMERLIQENRERFGDRGNIEIGLLESARKLSELARYLGYTPRE